MKSRNTPDRLALVEEGERLYKAGFNQHFTVVLIREQQQHYRESVLRHEQMF